MSKTFALVAAEFRLGILVSVTKHIEWMEDSKEELEKCLADPALPRILARSAEGGIRELEDRIASVKLMLAELEAAL